MSRRCLQDWLGNVKANLKMGESTKVASYVYDEI
jgi:hypothetical protein